MQRQEINPTQNVDRLVSRADAEKIMGLRPGVLAVWAHHGRYGLKFIKVGRLAKYRLSDLQAFLDSRTQEQTKEVENA